MTVNLNEVLDQVLVGDVLEHLSTFPDDCIDLTITSPPYNKNKKKGGHGWLVLNNGYSHYRDAMPEEEYQEWQVEVLNEIYRITKPGGSLFYNHKIRWEKGQMHHPFSWVARSQWVVRQEIVWDRIIAANLRGWRFWQVDERIYWLYKPIGKHLVGEELQSRHAKMSSIWRIQPAARRPEHPAPFPLALPTRIIYSLFDEETGKVILDPFCGLGTTLVAAKILGHHYIGIDISPEYATYCRRRLASCEEEVQEVLEEKANHFVKDPFQARKERGTVSWPYGPSSRNGNGRET